jgi:hypothetical protein
VTSTTQEPKAVSYQRQDLVPSKDRSWHGVTKGEAGNLQTSTSLVASTTVLLRQDQKSLVLVEWSQREHR